MCLGLCSYYDRTSKMVGQLKTLLEDTDVTASDSLGGLEDFKRDAAAYGEPPLAHHKLAMHGLQGWYRVALNCLEITVSEGPLECACSRGLPAHRGRRAEELCGGVR